jgi:transposase
MEHYAGIDVSLERSSVCVVDATGRVVREAKVASEPEALVRLFGELGLPLARVGLEAGPLSQWLHAGLTAAGFEAVLLETRHVKAALSAMIVKTDRKDARGIAQLLRMGWFRPVHRKSPPAQEVRALLVGRKLLQGKLTDVELGIRGLLRGFGLKLGEVSKGRFAARVRELVAGQAMLERVVEPMLRARDTLRAEFHALHRTMLGIVRADATCRRLMTVPGVGAVVAVTFTSAIDDPARFRRSRAVGAHFGLTPKKYQSGETDVTGGISKAGRRDGARGAVRGGERDADQVGQVLDAQALGAGGGAAPGRAAGQGGAGAQALDRPAPPVGRRRRVPLRQGGGGRMSG